jgi:hypothetical protein
LILYSGGLCPRFSRSNWWSTRDESGSRPQSLGIVFEHAQSGVAGRAQNTSHDSRFVIVVNAKLIESLGRTKSRRTNGTGFSQHAIDDNYLFDRDPILARTPAVTIMLSGFRLGPTFRLVDARSTPVLLKVTPIPILGGFAVLIRVGRISSRRLFVSNNRTALIAPLGRSSIAAGLYRKHIVATLTFE